MGNGHHTRFTRILDMILFDLIVGLVVVGLLALFALMFSKGRRQLTGPSASGPLSSLKAEKEVRSPRNKANMDQPQEEFIESQGAHADQDEAPRTRG